MQRASAPLAIACLLQLTLVGGTLTAQSSVRTVLGPVISRHPDVELSSPLDGAVLTDGTLAILDHAEQKLIAVTPDGRERYRIGRQGSGPGEFRAPYRVAAGRAGSVYVFDLGNQRIGRFDPSGRSIGDIALALGARVGGIDVLPDGKLLLSASGRAPGMAGRQIHVFDSLLRPVRSFAPTPDSLPDAAASRVTPLGLEIDTDGTIILTDAYSYGWWRFTTDGRLLERIALPFAIDPPAELSQAMRSGDGSRAALRSPTSGRFPRPVRPLGGGRYLVGYGVRDGGGEDAIVDRSGKVLARASRDASSPTVLSVDLRRGVVWVTEVDAADVPVLVQRRIPALRPGSAVP